MKRNNLSMYQEIEKLACCTVLEEESEQLAREGHKEFIKEKLEKKYNRKGGVKMEKISKNYKEKVKRESLITEEEESFSIKLKELKAEIKSYKTMAKTMDLAEKREYLNTVFTDYTSVLPKYQHDLAYSIGLSQEYTTVNELVNLQLAIDEILLNKYLDENFPASEFQLTRISKLLAEKGVKPLEVRKQLKTVTNFNIAKQLIAKLENEVNIGSGYLKSINYLEKCLGLVATKELTYNKAKEYKLQLQERFILSKGLVACATLEELQKMAKAESEKDKDNKIYIGNVYQDIINKSRTEANTKYFEKEETKLNIQQILDKYKK